MRSNVIKFTSIPARLFTVNRGDYFPTIQNFQNVDRTSLSSASRPDMTSRQYGVDSNEFASMEDWIFFFVDGMLFGLNIGRVFNFLIV